ncbi:MAG TPA: hypothetical protein VGP05_07130, partial [Pseudonocardia sp.]|nr:hypothetical protein [Pseudonocardia sp.]
MTRMITIDDPADPRLDDFRDLTNADRRPDRPGGRGLVIAEGVVVVRRLLESPYPLRALLGVPARLADLADDLAGRGDPAGDGDLAGRGDLASGGGLAGRGDLAGDGDVAGRGGQ